MRIERANTIKEQNTEILGANLFLWGSIFLLLGLSLGLGAYYSHIVWMRYAAFGMLVGGITLLLAGMKQDLDHETNNSFFSVILILSLLLLYFSLRMALPRFDFSVGDASDYYMAGVCSVTYNQDIGFFLPLTASVSALGYTLFGIDYTPFINVLLYVSSLPLSYFLFRRLGLRSAPSMLMTLFFLLTPLSIWFSKTSFSDPVWQLMLLLFALLVMYITDKERPDPKALTALFLLLGLTPFLRGEAALLYGMIVLIGLYHLWRFQKPTSALFIVSSFIMVIIGIYLALQIRAHYLLGWQFSRVIPHITVPELMNILYGAFILLVLLIVVLSRVKTWFSRINLPLVLTLLAVVFKVAIAYLYAKKKNGEFVDFFFMHEYSFMLGNFGLLLSIAIIAGLLLLYYNAIKGKRLALILVAMYTIFSIPFLMQNITFHDPHELFLYWNRYYFALLMMIHLFVLSSVVNLIYEQTVKITQHSGYRIILLTVLLGLVSLYSVNLKTEQIVMKEAYLENSYKVFSWLVQRVGTEPISVVYDETIRYERHNGLYDAKVFTARMFTVLKINAKIWQKVSLSQLSPNLKLKNNVFKSKYLVCFSSKERNLENDRLILVDKTVLPVSWREHYRAQPRSKKEVQGDVSRSYKNDLQLHLSLYRIKRRW